MGNCIDRQGTTAWVDDDDEDWGLQDSASSSHEYKTDTDGKDSPRKNGVASMEVKIKITKKQLDRLLKQNDGEDLTVRKVLEDLMSGGDKRFHDCGRQWKPALQSIPEAAEQYH